MQVTVLAWSRPEHARRTMDAVSSRPTCVIQWPPSQNLTKLIIKDGSDRLIGSTLSTLVFFFFFLF